MWGLRTMFSSVSTSSRNHTHHRQHRQSHHHNHCHHRHHHHRHKFPFSRSQMLPDSGLHTLHSCATIKMMRMPCWQWCWWSLQRYSCIHINIYMDILQHRVTMPSYMKPFFVFVFVCVFVIVNKCQEAVTIINFPQIYNRLGFWPKLKVLWR